MRGFLIALLLLQAPQTPILDGLLKEIQSLKVPAPTTRAQTLLTTEVPAFSGDDHQAYELGLRLVADVPGRVTAIRFWKTVGDTEPAHVGHLWSAAGALLATVTFTHETATGWQQQALATPVAIVAGQEVVVSVDAQTVFPATQTVFGASVTTGHLRAPSGVNGVFAAIGVFPVQSFASSNYFRDVVFEFAADAIVVVPPVIVPPVVVPPIVVPPVASGKKQLLTVADLHFECLQRLPDYSGFDYSAGILAARRVNGTLHFFITGSEGHNVAGQQILELEDAGCGGPDLATASQARLVKDWGNLFEGRYLTGTGLGGGSSTQIMGMFWKGDTLYQGYGDHYNVAGFHDPSIVAVRFNADGTTTKCGPWRTTAHSQKTRGWIVPLPAWMSAALGGATEGVGAGNTSGDANSPHGTYLAALTLPQCDTPADTAYGLTQAAVPGFTPHTTIVTTPLLAHDLNRRQKRDNHYRVVGWNVLYDYTTAFALPGPPASVEANVDAVHSAALIDTPTKSGLVFLGHEARSIPGFPYENGSAVVDVWYGINPGPFGQRSRGMSVGTGPASGSEAPVLWIYNPADLIKGGDPYAVEPTEVALFNLIAAIVPPTIYTAYQFGGQVWDAVSQAWFVTMVMFDQTARYDPKPVLLKLTAKKP